MAEIKWEGFQEEFEKLKSFDDSCHYYITDTGKFYYGGKLIAEKENFGEEKIRELVDQISLTPGPQGPKGDKGDPGADVSLSNDFEYATESNVLSGKVVKDKMVQLERETNEKATLITGKNIFSGRNWENGKFINWSTGAVADSVSYNACIDYISVNPDTDYAVLKVTHIAYYDISKNFIIGSNAVGVSIHTPTNAYYIRVDNSSNSDYKLQIELGTEQTSYEPYHNNIPDDQLSEYIQDSMARSINNLDNNYINVSVDNTNGRCIDTSGWNYSNGIIATYNNGIQLSVSNVTGSNPSMLQVFNSKGFKYKCVFKANVLSINGSITLKLRGALGKDIIIDKVGAIYLEDDVVIQQGNVNVFALFAPSTQSIGDKMCDIVIEKFAIVNNQSGLADGYILEDCLNIGDVNIAKYTYNRYNINGKIWGTIGDSLTAQSTYINPLISIFNLTRSNSSEGGKTMSGDANVGNPCMWEDSVIDKIDINSTIITIMGGTNDWAQSKPIGVVDSTNVTDYAGALNTAITKILKRCPSAKLVVIAPPYGELPKRVTDGSGWLNAYTNGIGKLITDYGDMAIEVARKQNVDYVNFGRSGWNAINKKIYLKDDGGWLHPNDYGGKRLASLLKPVFDNYI